MTTRKTSSSKSRTTSSNNLGGTKARKSSGTTTKTVSKSPRSKTQRNLEEKTKSLSSLAKEPKKTGKTSGTTAKAKAKSTKTATKNTTSTSKKPQKKPSVKRTTRQKRKDPGIKVMNSRKKEYFPYVSFPIFLQDLTENKKCWFVCVEHAQKYVDRYDHKYKCYQYTGVNK